MSNDTKQRIIDSALNLFATKGYNNTSMNDIINSINISKGSIYWHFSSKEAIYLSVVRESFNQWFELVERELNSIDDPLEKLRTYSNLFISTVNIPAWKISPEAYWADFEPSTQQEVEELFSKDDRIVEKILEEAMSKHIIREDDVIKLRWIYFSLLEGMFEKTVLAYREDPNTLEKTQAYAAEAIEMFINSIKA